MHDNGHLESVPIANNVLGGTPATPFRASRGQATDHKSIAEQVRKCFFIMCFLLACSLHIANMFLCTFLFLGSSLHKIALKALKTLTAQRTDDAFLFKTFSARKYFNIVY